jgi:hypothetical protein
MERGFGGGQVSSVELPADSSQNQEGNVPSFICIVCDLGQNALLVGDFKRMMMEETVVSFGW